MSKLFTPSSTDLGNMIKAAEAKCAADLERRRAAGPADGWTLDEQREQIRAEVQAAEDLGADLLPAGFAGAPAPAPAAPQLKTFRCTRNDPYRHACAGRDNLAARQGYPVEAVDRAAALREMRRDFPGDVYGFTATEWDEERGGPADPATGR